LSARRRSRRSRPGAGGCGYGGGEAGAGAGRERGPGWSRRVLFVALCYLVPLLWLVLAAFDPSAGRAVWPARWSVETSGRSYRGHHLPPMLNGLVLVCVSTVLTMVCAVLAAYPLSRYRSRLKRRTCSPCCS